jgi:large subunit ribosomal protein L18
MLERFKKKARRKNRIRTRVSGTAETPRLAVAASNQHIVAQIIDDTKGITLVYATDKAKDMKEKSKTDTAFKIGELIGEAAKKKNIKKVVFDRGGKLYHGRVKALAEGARKAGLEF